MAVLLLRRALPLSLVPPAARSARSSRFMTSATTAAMEHTTLFRSIFGKTSVFPSQPLLPIPDGFPFPLINDVDTLIFTRQAEDEKFKAMVILDSPQIINGNHCFDMIATIERGKWIVGFDIIAGPKTLLIKQVTISQFPESNRCRFKESVESKGITKGTVQSLLSLAKNKDGKIDCLERRPGKNRDMLFLDGFKETLNQVESEMQRLYK